MNFMYSARHHFRNYCFGAGSSSYSYVRQRVSNTNFSMQPLFSYISCQRRAKLLAPVQASANIRKVCVPACAQKAPNLYTMFSQTTLTNTPRRRHPADGQLSSIYPTSPSFSSFGAACVTLCRLPPPASSSTPFRPSVYYASFSLVVNIEYIRIFCDHLHIVYVVDQTCIVLKSGWNSTCLLYTSPSPRDKRQSRMPSSA